MARPLRIEYPSAVYPVMNRGNQRATGFHDDWHYAIFLDKLENFADEFNVVVYTYCCMPNHFHLQPRTKEANLSRFMQSFLTSFSISSNKKRHTSGHIFKAGLSLNRLRTNSTGLAYLAIFTLIRYNSIRFVTLPLRTVVAVFATFGDQVTALTWEPKRNRNGLTVHVYCRVGESSCVIKCSAMRRT